MINKIISIFFIPHIRNKNVIIIAIKVVKNVIIEIISGLFFTKNIIDVNEVIE